MKLISVKKKWQVYRTTEHETSVLKMTSWASDGTEFSAMLEIDDREFSLTFTREELEKLADEIHYRLADK